MAHPELLYFLVKDELRARRIGTGPWRAPAADSVIAPIADSVEVVLKAEIGRCATFEVVRSAASALARSSGEQFAARVKPSGPSQQSAAAANFHGENSLAARVVLELALRSRSQGQSAVDTHVAQRLSALGHQLWRCRLLADRLRSGLCEVGSVDLRNDGTFSIQVRDKPPFRISDYERAYFERMADQDRHSSAEDEALAGALVACVETGAPLPEALTAINSGLHKARGYGLVALSAALSFLSRLAGGDDVTTAGCRLSRGQLERLSLRNISSWYPHVEGDQIPDALRWLTWPQELLLESPPRPERYREIPARLYSRPVVELPDRSLFVPRQAANFSLYVFALRLFEGTWPEDLTPGDAELEHALKHRRSHVRPIEGFEQDLARQLLAVQLPHTVHVGTSPNQPSPKVGVRVRGEIDALVVQEKTKTIWVLEAKDLAFPHSAKRIRSELDKYFRTGGHEDKLQMKVEDIAATPEVVAAHLGVEFAAGWHVRGAFVTREPTPAQCDSRRRFPSLLLDRLGTFLVGTP